MPKQLRIASALSVSVLLFVACSSSSSTTGGGTTGGGGGDSGANGGNADGGSTSGSDGGAGTGEDAGTIDLDSGGSANDSGANGDASTPLTLTSTLLTNGGAWPAAYACGGAHADVSPPLAWSGGPAAKSYAIVMVDAFFMPPKVHWLVYDMAPGSSPLASGIPAGYTVAVPAAHQSLGDFTGAQFLSPCPPVGGGAHTY